MTRNRLAPLAVALGAAVACTNNPYVIGALCPPLDAGAVADPRCGGSGAGTTFDIGFATSGASQLGALALPSGDVAPAWRLLGQGASATSWTADVGGSLGVMSGAQPSDAAPFTDGTTRAAQLAATPTYVAADATTGAVGAGDFALEVVLRGAAGASVLDKRAGATGWSLRETAAGQLVLDLDDGVAPVVEVSSGTLTANAWYHCLFWVSRATVARADCDGSMGTPVTVPALGALDSSTEIVAGGGAAIEVAEVALFVPAGGLGSPSTWSAIGGRRFAELTGTSPRIARGSATPAPGLRGSEAYLDLQAATGPRALFLVGADWPRVACRTDTLGARACGYLSEPVRARHVPVAPSAWQANELLVTNGTTSFTGAPQVRFAALSATTANTVHSLSFTGAFGAARQIVSFFARASAAAARVEVSASAAGAPAVFDVVGGSVSSAPAVAHATIEPWGAGIFRCSYSFDAGAGPSTYTIGVLDATGAEMYAGQGAAALEIAGLQLDTGLAVAGSLLGADPQPADHLTFAADNGNLPTGTATSVSLSVLLPAGPRVTDQAIININHGGSFNDQVQLFVRGDAGLVKFWDLSASATHWTFDGSVSVIDGARHTIVASWNAASAQLAIDGMSVTQKALIANATPFVLDRIDVGFSETSSGALEGLVGGLKIGAM